MSTICVALLGLPYDHPMVPAHLRPLVERTVKDVQGQMTEAGFQYEFIKVSPENGLAGLSEELHSPDVVVIGNGIRGNMGLTPFLEQVIEALQMTAPQAKIAFNTLPENTVEVVRRVWPGAPPA